MPSLEEDIAALQTERRARLSPSQRPSGEYAIGTIEEQVRALQAERRQAGRSIVPYGPPSEFATPSPPLEPSSAIPFFSFTEPNAVGAGVERTLRGTQQRLTEQGQNLFDVAKGLTTSAPLPGEHLGQKALSVLGAVGTLTGVPQLLAPWEASIEQAAGQATDPETARLIGDIAGIATSFLFPFVPTGGSKIATGLQKVGIGRAPAALREAERKASVAQSVAQSIRPPTVQLPSALDDVARTTANALRGEAIEEQLIAQERFRQSPVAAQLLKKDLAERQAKSQIAGLSNATSPSPAPLVSGPPPPLAPQRGPKALPPAPPLAVTPQGQVVPRMARVRGSEAVPEGLVSSEPSGIQLIFKNPQVQLRFAEAASPSPKDYLAELGVTPANEANRDLLNRIINLESRGNPQAVNRQTPGGKDSGLFQFNSKNAKRLGVTEQSPVEVQVRAAEQRLAELPQEIGLDPTLSSQDRTRVLATAWLSPARTREALASAGKVAKGTKPIAAKLPTQPVTPLPPASPEMSPEVSNRMALLRSEIDDARTNLPTGRIYGTTEGETGMVQKHAIGKAESILEQFSPLYPELRELPKVGPKEFVTAIDKDKGNPLYLRIKDAVTRQMEGEEASAFDAFSRHVDELAGQKALSAVSGETAAFKQPWEQGLLEYAQSRVKPTIAAQITQRSQGRSFEAQHLKEINAALERGEIVPPSVLAEYPALAKQVVRPPGGIQPKLIQTQAELPPTPLQPKSPQVPHEDLLSGLKPQEPTRQGGLPLGTGESTVGSARYKPPPYTAEQLRTGPGVEAPPPAAQGLPPELGQTRLKVLARPGFERMAQQLDLLWQGKLPNPDATFHRNVGAAIKRGDIEFPGQREILAEHGITNVQLGDELMKAGTTWGQGLNMLSQMSKRVQRFARDNPEVAQALNVIPPPPKKLGWFRKLENTRTAMITGTVRNAMRNAEGGLAATFLDAMEQGVANIAVGARKGNMAQEIAGGMEQFSTILKAMKPGQQRQFLKVLDDFPLEKLDLLSTPVQDVMMKGMGMEKIIGWAQFLNRTQEMWVRGLAFSGSVRGEMVRRGIPLTTPSKNIPADIIEKGIADALRVTSAARPERGTVPGQLSSRVLEFYHAAPILRLVNPFPRFQYANTFRFLWEHSPFGPLDLLTKGQLAKQTTVRMPMVKHLAAKFVKEHGRQPGPEELQRFYAAATKPTPQALKAQQELQNPKTAALALTKSATGLGILALALAYRSSDDAPNKWYEVKAPQFVPGLGGKTISGEAFAPFITFNLFAEGIRAAVAAYGTQEMKETFNVIKKPPVVERKDIARAVIGLNRVAGTGLVFIDLLEKGGGWPRVMDFFNQYVGSFTVPLSSVKNLMAGVRPKEAVIRDVTTAAPLTGPARRNVPFLGSETLPSSPSITRATPRRMENPVSGELTGLTKKTYTPLEHEVNRLGLPWYELRPRSGIPEADLYMQRVMGTVLDRPEVEAKILSPDFQRQPNLEKERRLRGYFSSARGVALQQLQSEKPALYQQVWKKKNQGKLDWIQSFQPPPLPR